MAATTTVSAVFEAWVSNNAVLTIQLILSQLLWPVPSQHRVSSACVCTVKTAPTIVETDCRCWLQKYVRADQFFTRSQDRCAYMKSGFGFPAHLNYLHTHPPTHTHNGGLPVTGSSGIPTHGAKNLDTKSYGTPEASTQPLLLPPFHCYNDANDLTCCESLRKLVHGGLQLFKLLSVMDQPSKNLPDSYTKRFIALSQHALFFKAWHKPACTAVSVYLHQKAYKLLVCI